MDEYSYRHKGKTHKLEELLYFFDMYIMKINLRRGLYFPEVKLSKINIPYKCIPINLRCKDIEEGYRKLYKKMIASPFDEYRFCKRDIPEWILPKNSLFEQDMNVYNQV